MLEQQLVNAISLGGVYALFALGFTLVFGVLGVINLGHGAVFMLGAYASLQSVSLLKLPLAGAILVSMLATGIAGWLIDKLIFAPLRARRAPHRLGCARKKAQLAAVASGPPGSVKGSHAQPPDHACPGALRPHRVR